MFYLLAECLDVAGGGVYDGLMVMDIHLYTFDRNKEISSNSSIILVRIYVTAP